MNQLVKPVEDVYINSTDSTRKKCADYENKVVDGKKLKEIRSLLGLNQAEFAAKYIKYNVTRDMVTAYETGRTKIPEWFADRVAEEAANYEIRKRIPIIGYVSAGETDVAFTDQGYPVGSGFDEVDRPAKVHDPHAYALRIRGDSMFPAYREGDTIICDTTKPVVNKDDAVVRVKGKAYLKIWWEMAGEIILRSYNNEQPEIRVRLEDVEFRHKVVSVDLK